MQVKKIIIHYSATPQGESYTAADIRRWHLQRGFNDIGYHWVIRLDGTIEPGRSETKIGAHCLGQNAQSIGICYIGGCPPRTTPGWANKGIDTRTPAQKAALIKLLRELKTRYPNATIHGHNEFAAKPCPGFNARQEYANL